ncbi:aldehyde dehydrogenase [Cyanobacterium sp. IPPAS B-1200]|uniref:aldehyde dehydrogenase n=1 Tax=Cyanobacterium sp. IPPAS B-1200 TaxID=1562720 RepID=UPI0008527863|nr:aldehyde dehydrogenase [Cyanobacterium sp. IPPAS B-1200]OEJ79925.1 aldehyde dehydrogenase [Cyanobacterium sp. IPPAS B-1200]
MTITNYSMQSFVDEQRKFFASGQTKSYDFRLQQLKKLKEAIALRQDKILEALHQDLGKPSLEGCFELAVISEISYAIKNLKKWMKPKRVSAGIENFPACAKIHSEPLGVVLIIGPWNYPFTLMISPLLGAIASGNCAMLKPSELAPHTSALITELIKDIFPPEYICIQEGGVEVAQELLATKFDHIFFTGGTKIGQIVMESAAKQLTPVTLELGGKSPCVVDKETNLKITAQRITWGKFINAGQTCIAPDYILVDKAIKQEFIQEIKQCVHDFFGDNPAQSQDFARIINQKQFDRLEQLLGSGNIIVGGETNRENKYIAPTIIDNVPLNSPIMAEEIFGPIMPILEYNHLDEAINIINSKPKPLALYFFSNNSENKKRILHETSSGGLCFNETIMQVGVKDLPFGGVGDSGIGAYHGKTSFDTFSHKKAVLSRYFWGDLKWRYAPYSDKIVNTFKKFYTK